MLPARGGVDVSRLCAMLCAGHSLPLQAYLEIPGILHDFFKLLCHELQLFQKLLWVRVLLKLDGFDERLGELLPHDVHSVHLEVGIPEGDEIRDDLRVKLFLNFQEGLNLPLTDFIWKLGLVLSSSRDYPNLLENRQVLWNPLCCAVLDPPVHGLR